MLLRSRCILRNSINLYCHLFHTFWGKTEKNIYLGETFRDCGMLPTYRNIFFYSLKKNVIFFASWDQNKKRLHVRIQNQFISAFPRALSLFSKRDARSGKKESLLMRLISTPRASAIVRTKTHGIHYPTYNNKIQTLSWLVVSFKLSYMLREENCMDLNVSIS